MVEAPDTPYTGEASFPDGKSGDVSISTRPAYRFHDSYELPSPPTGNSLSLSPPPVYPHSPNVPSTAPSSPSLLSLTPKRPSTTFGPNATYELPSTEAVRPRTVSAASSSKTRPHRLSLFPVNPSITAPDDYTHIRDPSLKLPSSPTLATSQAGWKLTQENEDGDRENFLRITSSDPDRQKSDIYDRPAPPPPSGGW